MNELTAFQRDCLRGTAMLTDPHGLSLKEWLHDERDEKINHGRLYPNLDTLVEKGLVSKSKVDGRTNEYTLTARGKREVELMRDLWAEAAAVDDDQHLATTPGDR